MVQVGDQVTVKVLKFDKDKERISLGLKQMYPDPWANIDAQYPPQSKVIGRVVSVTDYGAFVELEPGVEGLIHISRNDLEPQDEASCEGGQGRRPGRGSGA